jgi:hypothetical protein
MNRSYKYIQVALNCVAGTEVRAGCSALEIQSLFIGSKLAGSTILRSAGGVWHGGGGGRIFHIPTHLLFELLYFG